LPCVQRLFELLASPNRSRSKTVRSNPALLAEPVERLHPAVLRGNYSVGWGNTRDADASPTVRPLRGPNLTIWSLLRARATYSIVPRFGYRCRFAGYSGEAHGFTTRVSTTEALPVRRHRSTPTYGRGLQPPATVTSLREPWPFGRERRRGSRRARACSRSLTSNPMKASYFRRFSSWRRSRRQRVTDTHDRRFLTLATVA